MRKTAGLLFTVVGAALIGLSFLVYLASGLPSGGLSKGDHQRSLATVLLYLGGGGMIAGLVMSLAQPRAAANKGSASDGHPTASHQGKRPS